MAGEDDEDEYTCIYEDGHWDWNDTYQSLVFVSDRPQIEEDFSPPTPTLIGAMDFRDDLDLMEQQRFRKRFQKHSSDKDCVTLQDIKDVVFFTAPKGLLTRTLINIFHMPVTERFIRALILYCQYFIQISDEMSKRLLEIQYKVRTPATDDMEIGFRENLEDLRLLVAKEYSLMITGAGDIAKYHHMGASKKLRSLSKRDLVLFESILRISIQIVWLALGRQSLNKIELEVHRLFKSSMYNIVEHNLNMNYEASLSDRENFVLFGHCLNRKRVINMYSPLNNEMQCHRHIDYRLLGLGVVKYPQLRRRLRHLESILIAPEGMFEQLKLSLGIIGMPRAGFDTMLKEIKMPATTASSTTTSGQSIAQPSRSKVSTSGSKKSIKVQLLNYIYIPEKFGDEERLSDDFPTELYPKSHCNERQRRKWLAFISRRQHKRQKSSK